jgi:PAS domain S-box-containing protein
MTIEHDKGLAQAILAQAADAVIFADTGGVIRIWNAAAVRIFGFTAEEAVGKSLDLIIPDHLRQAHWKGFRRAMQSGTTRLGGRPILTRGLHRSGRRLYVEMSFAVVRAPSGLVAGSVAVARDATERHEKERTRRQQSETGPSESSGPRVAASFAAKHDHEMQNRRSREL